MYPTLLARYRKIMQIVFEAIPYEFAHLFTKIIESMYVEEARLVAEAVREINEKEV